MKNLPLILLLLLLFGCASNPLDVSRRTRIYQADFKAVFKAVISYCEKHSFPIRMADKDLGLVNTDWINTGGAVLGNRMKINFSLKDQGPTTKVVLTVTTQQQSISGSGAYEGSSLSQDQALDLYKIFDGIQGQL